MVTCARDTTADLVIHELEARGVEVLRLNTERFPAQAQATVTCEPNRTSGHMHLGGDHELALEEVTAVWYRRPEPPEPAPATEPGARPFVVRESRAMLYGFLNLVRARWVNHPDHNAAAEYKPAQLRLAAELGLRTPRTVFTNDPQSARKFVDSCSGDVVAKTVRMPLVDASGPTLVYTNRLGERDLDRLDELRYAPCILQEHIAKRVELRVTVVGNETFTAEIDSQASISGSDDWRRSGLDELPHRPYRLPREVSDRCLAICRYFGLTFATFDFVVTPEGEHVFLEVNPNGEWGWIADLTGFPIAEALADTLTRGVGTSPGSQP